MKTANLALLFALIPLYLWAQAIQPAPATPQPAAKAPPQKAARTPQQTQQKKTVPIKRTAPVKKEQPLQTPKPVVYQQWTPDKKDTFPFSTHMMRAQKNQGWARSYLASYKRSKEGKYLELAARHMNNAITTYNTVQNRVLKTSRFYYKARSKRLVACSYYKILRSEDRGKVKVVPPLAQSLCNDH